MQLESTAISLNLWRPIPDLLQQQLSSCLSINQVTKVAHRAIASNLTKIVDRFEEESGNRSVKTKRIVSCQNVPTFKQTVIVLTTLLATSNSIMVATKAKFNRSDQIEASNEPFEGHHFNGLNELMGSASNFTSYFADSTSAPANEASQTRAPKAANKIVDYIEHDEHDNALIDNHDVEQSKSILGYAKRRLTGQADQPFEDFDDYQALGLDKFYLAADESPDGDADDRDTAEERLFFEEQDAGDYGERQQQSRASSKRDKRKMRFQANKRRAFGTSNGRSHGTDEKLIPRKARLENATRLHGVASNMGQTQDQSEPQVIAAANSCAIELSSGTCITFQMVELALRQARRALGFNSALDHDEDLEDGRAGANWAPEPSERQVNAVGELNELTTRILARHYRLSPSEIANELEQIDIRQTSLWRVCPPIYRWPLARSCLAGSALLVSSSDGDDDDDDDDDSRAGSRQLRQILSARYRSHTGQCNNLLEPRLGASYMPFVRMMPAQYGDSVGWTRRSASGSSLPPPRLLALHLHPDASLASSDLSALFASWGQLINHDLAMASNARGTTGHHESCCKWLKLARQVRRPSGGSALAPGPQTGDGNWRVCMPIEIGLDDPVYGPHGIRCLDFKRSLAGLRPGCSLGPRTQLNLVSSFVDASFVYGSTRRTSGSIRDPEANGRLATWNYFGGRQRPLKPLLPAQVDQPDEDCVGRSGGLYCFRSGDPRTNQQLPLVVLHTIHTRQHNRLVDGLELLNPHWPAGRLYEEARRIHIALVQHILLAEYLTQLLGTKQCQLYQLVESPYGQPWDHYDPATNPGIAQEFAAAAFRQGHSSVPSVVARHHLASRQAKQLYPLRRTFNQPWALFEPGAMDELLLGQVDTAAQAIDPFVSEHLSGHLLEGPGERVGHDLIAINIQRGRDQGVASYNSVRHWCGLGRFEHFGQLDGVMSNQSAHLMGELYESVDDIDLFSGGISEFPLEGSQVGPTFACVIGRQFQALRQGDRLWFESSSGPHAFSQLQLDSIKQVSLARLICANSDQLDTIQSLAMQLPHPVLNPLQPCASLPDVDLTLWQEVAPAA